LSFEPDWENRLQSYVNKNGCLHGPKGIDYFVFPRGFWNNIPPLAIGRTKWDNWLLYQARLQEAYLVDITQAVMVIHQNHDFAHHSEGKKGVREGPEAKRNLELIGGQSRSFNLQDATHALTPIGLKRVSAFKYMRRRLDTLPVFYPWLRIPLKTLKKIINFFVFLLEVWVE
jgi:hypothetical protein